MVTRLSYLNSLRPRQNGRHFADDIFKCIFLNENVWIPIKISLKFVPRSPINNIPALVQIMAWRRPGAKLLSEAMMVSLTTHICVARLQWVNDGNNYTGKDPIFILVQPPDLFHVAFKLNCHIELNKKFWLQKLWCVWCISVRFWLQGSWLNEHTVVTVEIINKWCQTDLLTQPKLLLESKYNHWGYGWCEFGSKNVNIIMIFVVKEILVGFIKWAYIYVYIHASLKLTVDP